MEEGRILSRLLLPAYQQAAKPIESVMTTLHHPPAPCPLACFARDPLRFLTATVPVRREATFTRGGAHLDIGIAAIRTHPLPLRHRQHQLRHDDTCNGCALGSFRGDGRYQPPSSSVSPDRVTQRSHGRIRVGFFLQQHLGYRPGHPQSVLNQCSSGYHIVRR